MALSRAELLALARKGAAARLQELQDEISKIRKTFGKEIGAMVVGVRAGVDAFREGRQRAARKRAKLSAKGRAAIVAAQRARWAKVRKSGGRKRKATGAGKAAVSKKTRV